MKQNNTTDSAIIEDTEVWEIIEKQKVVDKKIGSSFIGVTIYFKTEYIIRNKITGELRRV